MTSKLLALIPLQRHAQEDMARTHELVYAPDRAAHEAAVAAYGREIEIVLTNGSLGLSAAEIDALPALKFIGVWGAGFENVAVEHAKERGIVVATGAGTNADSVADHAMSLLLSTVRAIPVFDKACRAGVWRTGLPMQPLLTGKKVGLIGLGAVGQAIVDRCAGFRMEIGYHTRSRRQESAYRYFESTLALAAWCDFLVIATPGGPETLHMVDAKVLAALGPGGFLVNIARGSVVDTEALAKALREDLIAGAGLDVYEGEPAAPTLLTDLENVVLTPHVAGASPEAQQAMLERFVDNVRRFDAGEPVVSRI